MNEYDIARILGVIAGVWLAMSSLGLFFRNWNFNSK